jgi:hypothetical protein
LEQLVELLDLGRVLLGGGAGPVDDRAALVQAPLPSLERLLLVEERACQLLDLASLLRCRFGREPAQRLGDDRTWRSLSRPDFFVQPDRSALKQRFAGATRALVRVSSLRLRRE